MLPGAAQIVAKPGSVRSSCQRLVLAVNAVRTFGH